jgi:DNA-binding transcriptional LysR family regulator
LSIAERGSFQRAAAHLNLSQTALSHRMRKFEADLGVKLLRRTTRQVSLSPAGLALMPGARRMMDELEGTLDRIRSQGEERPARVAIGCLPTIAAHYLPRLLRAFAARHPGLAVTVHDNSAAEIAALVQSGAAEFGITILSASRADLEIKPLFKEPFVLVCPADHAFARKRGAAWSELIGTPLIRISPQAGNRALIDDALGPRREQLLWGYEVQHIATAISLVAEGLGLAVVPRLAVDKREGRGAVAVPLRHPGVVRTLGILSRRGVALSEPAQALADLIAARFKAEN